MVWRPAGLKFLDLVVVDPQLLVVAAVFSHRLQLGRQAGADRHALRYVLPELVRQAGVHPGEPARAAVRDTPGRKPG